MKHIKLIKLFILIFILSSCHQIHEGVIIDKYIIPAHKYVYYTSTLVGKVSVLQSHIAYVEDEYVLLVKGIKESDTITEEFSVSVQIYNCKVKNDIFNDTIPCEIYNPK